MKKLLLPLFVVIIVYLVGDTSTPATIVGTNSSPVTSPWPGNISSRFLVQSGANLMRDANQARTLTFAERVSYQRAIEEVYWRHRIWPKERPDPKPSLDAVMTQRQLERKVSDYVRNSQALEDYWQRPITPDQLQGEMERMASHTKQPGVLREIFEALGNDPFVIAECLARPALAERLLTTLYAHDQRFHGELKRHAEVELQTHRSVSQMKQTSGMYTEMEWIKSDNTPDQDKGGSARNAFGDDGKANRQSRDTEHGITLNSREWNENVQKLAKEFGNTKVGRARPPGAPGRLGTDASAQIKTGVLSPLRENEGRYYATAVLRKTKDRLKLATVEWRKEPLESWRARAERQMPKPMTAMTGSYTLPTILAVANGCTDDTWATTATDVPTPRFSQTAVWTGSEMIVWGGFNGAFLNTGAKYNPSTDSWAATSSASAPTVRYEHTAVWSGSEMIVWGGYNGAWLNTGRKYDPGTDSWTGTSTTNAPTVRDLQTAVWSGSEMIVWGGYNGTNVLNTGGRYNPSTDSWAATSTANAPTARVYYPAVWSGSEMIVWGGYDGSSNVFNTGGRYNPSTDNWTATSRANAPFARAYHTAVWTGSEMIVWGGYSGADVNSGGTYDPTTDTWTATSVPSAVAGRELHTAVWSGNEMIVWGGVNNGTVLSTGGRYSPSADSWTVTSVTNAPDGRGYHTAVWTGNEMIVWGGESVTDYFNTGGRYCAQFSSIHPAFFSGEVSLGNGVYYLQFPNGTPFGYYSYLTDPRFIYHFDLGYEYWFNANDGQNGIYFYDFMSTHFFYTSPSFPFPYLYDFTLNTVLYYYPDANNPGHYTTNPRYFYNFATGQIITM